MLLVKEKCFNRDPRRSPYTDGGSQWVIREFRDEVLLFLEQMHDNHVTYKEGVTYLHKSCLRNRAFIAGALKTQGLVAEDVSEHGSCMLTLTEKGIRAVEALIAKGHIQQR